MSHDCAWSADVLTWLDSNGNGIRDAGEPPLGGIKLSHGGLYQQQPVITNSKGEAILSEFMPGCPDRIFGVHAETPAGYKITTPDTIRSAGPNYGSDPKYEFGFAPLPGASSSAGSQPSMSCTVYHLLTATDDDSVADLAVAPDGTVWVSMSGSGVARLLPGTVQWTYFTTKDGLGGNDVGRITIMPDKSVWFGTASGASHFDGKAWKTYTQADGLIDNDVRKVIMTDDGSLWFATTHGVPHFQPQQRLWQSFTAKDGLAEDYNRYVAFGPDGALWFASLSSGLNRLRHYDPAIKPIWDSFSITTSGAGNIPLGSVSQIVFDSDGTGWFGGLVATGKGGVLRLDAKTGVWSLHHDGTQARSDADYMRALTIAPDHSLWIGTHATPPQIYHFIPARDSQPEVWQIYDTRDGLPQVGDHDTVQAVAAASNDTIWIATSDAATRCDLKR